MNRDAAAVVYVRDREIPRLLGREGRRIAEIERDLGIHIDVRAMKDRSSSPIRVRGQVQSATVDMDRKNVILQVGKELSGQSVEVMVEGTSIFQGTVGRDGVIRVGKGSPAGKALEDAFFAGKRVTVEPAD